MKIALIGYGKMGKAIEEIALQKGHEVLYRIDVDSMDLLEKDRLSQADAAIEFTTPDTAFDNIMKCFDAGVPVVSGTTGWLSRLDTVRSRCLEEGHAFLYASNFSIGVNLFFELNKRLAALMDRQPQYEVSLEEIHHTQKKDAPSGTAITLAEDILQQVSRKKQWVNALSADPEQLGIVSRRIDPAPGTHVVRYTSEVDDIEIRHTAHSRKGFASGALTAAEWLVGKKGVFSMQDVLGL
jgi:4-hydroxy-tetrahydrodipicolinate reductase